MSGIRKGLKLTLDELDEAGLWDKPDIEVTVYYTERNGRQSSLTLKAAAKGVLPTTLPANASVEAVWAHNRVGQSELLVIIRRKKGTP